MSDSDEQMLIEAFVTSLPVLVSPVGFISGSVLNRKLYLICSVLCECEGVMSVNWERLVVYA